MRIKVRQLRKIICEAIDDVELHETFDDTDYEVSVPHSKILTLDSGEKVTIPNYSSSQLRAKINKSRHEMMVVNLRVSSEGQGKNLGLRMGMKAKKFADSHGLKLVSSGVYSPQGARFVSALEKRGKIVNIDGRDEVKEALGFYLSDYQAGPNGQHQNNTENPGGYGRTKLGLDTRSELDTSYDDATMNASSYDDNSEMEESVVTDEPGNHTPDDMNRILSYGLELGNDDGTGESGGTEDINGGKTHESASRKRAQGPPDMHLGKSYLDDNDPENTDEDFTVKPSNLRREIFEPGYQEFARTMDHSADDVDSPTKMTNEDAAWSTCVELYDTVKDIWGIKSMSNPAFIDYALEELRKDGTPDGICSRMRFKLENENSIED